MAISYDPSKEKPLRGTLPSGAQIEWLSRDWIPVTRIPLHLALLNEITSPLILLLHNMGELTTMPLAVYPVWRIAASSPYREKDVEPAGGWLQLSKDGMNWFKVGNGFCLDVEPIEPDAATMIEMRFVPPPDPYTKVIDDMKLMVDEVIEGSRVKSGTNLLIKKPEFRYAPYEYKKRRSILVKPKRAITLEDE